MPEAGEAPAEVSLAPLWGLHSCTAPSAVLYKLQTGSGRWHLTGRQGTDENTVTLITTAVLWGPARLGDLHDVSP